MRLGASGLLINEKTVGPDGNGERDGGMLAGIEKSKGRVGGWVRKDLTPGWRLCNPAQHRCGRICVPQLPGDSFRQEHTPIEGLQHFHGADHHKLTEGAGISHDDHAGTSAVCFFRAS